MFRALVGLTASLLVVCILSPGALAADETTRVAGRTMDQYAAMLPSDDRVVRLRAARSLAPFGAAAGEILRQALDHDDAAVRFIAAEQLGRIGGESLENATHRLGELTEDPSSKAVQMAASFALCRRGMIETHLPLLIELLDYPERGMACTAAYLIGEIGPAAKPAEASLEETFAKNKPGGSEGDYHLGGASLNALRKIRGQ